MTIDPAGVARLFTLTRPNIPQDRVMLPRLTLGVLTLTDRTLGGQDSTYNLLYGFECVVHSKATDSSRRSTAAMIFSAAVAGSGSGGPSLMYALTSSQKTWLFLPRHLFWE